MQINIKEYNDANKNKGGFLPDLFLLPPIILNNRENSKRIDHNFKKGDWATLVRPGAVERTLAIKCRGPYKLLKQHKNASITIQVAPYN